MGCNLTPLVIIGIIVIIAIYFLFQTPDQTQEGLFHMAIHGGDIMIIGIVIHTDIINYFFY